MTKYVCLRFDVNFEKLTVPMAVEFVTTNIQSINVSSTEYIWNDLNILFKSEPLSSIRFGDHINTKW